MRTCIALLSLLFASISSLDAQEIKLNAPQFALLINEAAVKELKLTADQQKQIDDIFGDMVQTVEGEKRLIVRGQVDLEEVEKDVLKVLNDTQRKRLRQAWIQLNGPMALTDTTLAKDVGLKEEQSKKITEAVTNMNDAMRDVFHQSEGDQEKMREGVVRLRKNAANDIEAMLTPDQKKKLESLKGAKIEGLKKEDKKKSK
ncbi:MAG: hypothetical protein JNJ77_11850 [Planctomycetia bacterium]|nr:hypothetical protein [Planctomycetia bacterium]